MEIFLNNKKLKFINKTNQTDEKITTLFIDKAKPIWLKNINL